MTESGKRRYSSLSKRKAKKEAKNDYLNYVNSSSLSTKYLTSNRDKKAQLKKTHKTTEKTIVDKSSVNEDYKKQIERLKRWDKKHSILTNDALDILNKQMKTYAISSAIVTGAYIHASGADKAIGWMLLTKLESSLNTARGKRVAEEAIPKIADFTVDYVTENFRTIDDIFLGKVR